LRPPVESAQFTSWAFSERVRQAGLVPSMGTVGAAFDNAVIESLWARLQTELLNRTKWKTRVELSTALFDYLEIFHNRNRRHSSLGMLTPIEYEKGQQPNSKRRLTLTRRVHRTGARPAGPDSGGFTVTSHSRSQQHSRNDRRVLSDII
jgi:putative transposase